jgi:Na+-transporting NADH:ubiquinone oxidoreductase subunit NqrC
MDEGTGEITKSQWVRYMQRNQAEKNAVKAGKGDAWVRQWMSTIRQGCLSEEECKAQASFICSEAAAELKAAAEAKAKADAKDEEERAKAEVTESAVAEAPLVIDGHGVVSQVYALLLMQPPGDTVLRKDVLVKAQGGDFKRCLPKHCIEKCEWNVVLVC